MLYRIILITRIDLYISENNERETCSRRYVYSFTEASLEKILRFPRTLILFTLLLRVLQ